jgi:hypothetical protein
VRGVGEGGGAFGEWGEDAGAAGLVDFEAGGFGALEDPFERGAPEVAVGGRVAAADVAVDAGEPGLDEVLFGGVWAHAVLAEEAAAFVAGDGVADDADAGVARGEGEGLGVPDPAEGGDGVPDAEEVDGEAAGVGVWAFGDEAGEGPAEVVDEFPVLVVFVAAVGAAAEGAEELHDVGDHVVSPAREQAEGVEEAGECAGGVGAAAEAEDEDFVAGFPVVHEVGVGFLDVGGEAGAEGESGEDGEFFAEGADGGGLWECADAGVVEEALDAGGAVDDLCDADDVGVDVAEGVAGAVTADDDVAWHV